MVAVLTKIFGIENIETAEDVTQQTFLDAINMWKLKGIPPNPSAWLFKVAKNKAIDVIRRNKHSLQYDFNDGERKLLTSEYTLSVTMDSLWKEEFIKDDLLRMMFTCCHPAISQHNQVTLILKTLCGFSTAEIAKAFLTSEETISKRLYRTKEFFRTNKIPFVIPSVDDLKHRTGAVLNAIYLLFNEGYNATHAEHLIRQDLIDEAMLLCRLLTENSHTQLPEVYALMALMCFHAARSKSRLTTNGEIILLPHQDRTRWDFGLIAMGNDYMNKAAAGSEVSTYHIEAAIAFEHCTAPGFNQTNWRRIVDLYDWLYQLSPSPISALNKCVAIMQVNGAAEALESLNDIPDKEKLFTYYLYHSLLGEIYCQLDRFVDAKASFETAIGLTQSETEKKILKEKLIGLLHRQSL